ncbi:hypothetical protein OUZ56_005089 [Daphnia magna]|uniref:Uncharacterized protein n=1 Tax=Daphnia magna TaxID=35525 RepID=A0ABQ9YRS9_9CRUS|nr:hypothetical protein OUZ56_005089 [Daphnia magna]
MNGLYANEALQDRQTDGRHSQTTTNAVQVFTSNEMRNDDAQQLFADDRIATTSSASDRLTRTSIANLNKKFVLLT